MIAQIGNAEKKSLVRDVPNWHYQSMAHIFRISLAKVTYRFFTEKRVFDLNLSPVIVIYILNINPFFSNTIIVHFC